MAKHHLEDDKLALEIRELEQKLKLIPLRTIVTSLGVFLFLLALGIESCRLREQRKFDRKIQIAERYEDLVGRTNAVLESAPVDVLSLRLSVETLIEQTGEFRADLSTVKGQERLLQQAAHVEYVANSLLMRLEKGSYDYRVWHEGVLLDGLWQAHAEHLSPDFEQLFGKALSQQWPEVASEARAMLAERFSLIGGLDLEERTARFRSVSSSFQEAMYKEILN